ncbi:MAG: exopolysaccharide biosynthesis polyprenyl glycosylphosphotransferase [Cyanobacteriota bacterium]|nr:exopolysaccharide biosynthesis polyprenyl glycosylphosphotransferase [Cyanobacteriota bacterium]
MGLRAPWLRQRLLMLGLAVFDGLCLALTYNVTRWVRLDEGSWVGLNRALAMLIALWLSTSYLLGRYSEPEPDRRGSLLLRLAMTALVPLLILAVVLGHSWAFQVADARTRFRGFLLPMLGITTLLSGMAQIVLSTWRQERRRWLLLGKREELTLLKGEVACHPPSTHLELFWRTPEQFGSQDLPTLPLMEGIAISDHLGLPEDLLQTLLQERVKGTAVSSLVNWAEHHLQRVPPELLSNRWLLNAEGFGLQPSTWTWRLKRSLDLIGAGALVLLCLPLMLVSAVLIWITDRGPVFYGQTRTGLYGKPFKTWKLRTMRLDAESGGVRWASRADDRITPVGRWLRRLRIDELPQLLAVILGEMSLIGPRPERPELEEELERRIPHYRVRHWIRPGLSGWAQVCFPYGASVADSRMKLSYDLYYLRNANLLLDLLILIKTIRLVAGARGAVPIEPTAAAIHSNDSAADQP